MRSLITQSRRLYYSLSVSTFRYIGWQRIVKCRLCTATSSICTATDNISSEESTESQMHAQIMQHRQDNNLIGICSTYWRAKNQGIRLKGSDYITIFKAYTTYDPSNHLYMNYEAFHVFNILSDLEIMTLDVLEQMTKLCRYHLEGQKLIEANKKYEQRFKNIPVHMAKFIEALVHCSEKEMALEYYTIYKDKRSSNAGNSMPVMFNSSWPALTPDIYIGLCTLLCTSGNKFDAYDIIKDFCSDVSIQDIVKSIQTNPVTLRKTHQLIDNALILYDLKLLEPMLALCRHAEVQFDEGQITKMFEVSAALSRPDMVEVVSSIVKYHGRALTPIEHAHVVIANIRGRKLEKAIESMVVAESAGVNFLCDQNNSENSLVYPEYIQESLSKLLVTSRDLDQLYFALVNLIEHNIRPPPLALNCVILGAGKLNSMDRAFSMIQEFDTVFLTVPNLYTYRALLEAVAKSKQPKLSALFTIMQDMDSSGHTPDAFCYSLVIETMLLLNDTSALDEVILHMESENIKPRVKTLRKLALFFQKNSESDKVKHFCDMMRSHPGYVIPQFFRKRLKYVSMQL